MPGTGLQSSVVISASAALIALAALVLTRRDARQKRRREAESLAWRAFDLLGGGEGTYEIPPEEVTPTDEAERTFELAHRLLCEAEHVDRTCGRIQFVWGVYFARRGELGAAERCYRRALKAAPRDWQTVSALCDLLLRRGAYREGLQLAVNSVTLNPGHWSGYYETACALSSLGHKDDARQAIDLSLKVSTENFAPFAVRAELRLDNGEFAEALDDINNAIARNSSIGKLFWIRGSIRIRAAGGFLALALSQDEGYNTRRLSYVDPDSYEKAMADFDRSLELDPEFWRSYESRAFLWLMANRRDRALEDLTLAIGIEPAAIGPYIGRAVTLAWDGDTAAATDDVVRARRLLEENEIYVDVRDRLRDNVDGIASALRGLRSAFALSDSANADSVPD